MPTTKKPTRKPSPEAVLARALPVGEGEKRWTVAEVKELQAELAEDVARLEAAVARAEADVDSMRAERTDGPGGDAADVGTANFERDQGMSMAASFRTMLGDTCDALARLDSGTYGQCEQCGQAIGKGRLMAFPRASLCVKCKQRQERR